MLLPAMALAATFVLGTPSLERLAPGSPPRRSHPDLALRIEVPAPHRGAPSVEVGPAAAGAAAANPPVCSGDVCQPVVAVPGFEPRFARSSRQELAVSLLARVHMGPLARIVWGIVSTGVCLDYTPPALDWSSPRPHGWGSFVVRFRVRLDADGTPVFPVRPE